LIAGVAALVALTMSISTASANHAAPAGLKVTGTTETSVGLDWNDYTLYLPDDYHVRVSNSSGTFLFVRELDPNPRDGLREQSQYTVTGLTAGTTYRFDVRAEAVGGHLSLISSKVSATTNTSTPPPPPPPPPSRDAILYTAREIADMPTSGPEWTALVSAATRDISGWTKMNYNGSDHDTFTLAKAVYYAKTGNDATRMDVRNQIETAMGTENLPSVQGDRHLNIARNAFGYVVAAQLINLPALDPALDSRFRTWIKSLRDEGATTDGEGLIATQIRRPNNHGTSAAASRAAVDAYLDDATDMAKAAQVLKGWMGDLQAYNGFSWTTSSPWGSWMVDSTAGNRQAIQPVGATKLISGASRNIDGAQPTEMSRAGTASWPPAYTGYAAGATEGAHLAVRVMMLNGHPDIHLEQSSALRRAVDFLRRLAFVDPVESVWWSDRYERDLHGVPHMVNYLYGTAFPETSLSSPRYGQQGAAQAAVLANK
jgi:Alginate lyase/Fibronectin type III domain